MDDWDFREGHRQLTRAVSAAHAALEACQNALRRSGARSEERLSRAVSLHSEARQWADEHLTATITLEEQGDSLVAPLNLNYEAAADFVPDAAPQSALETARQTAETALDGIGAGLESLSQLQARRRQMLVGAGVALLVLVAAAAILINNQVQQQQQAAATATMDAVATAAMATSDAVAIASTATRLVEAREEVQAGVRTLELPGGEEYIQVFIPEGDFILPADPVTNLMEQTVRDFPAFWIDRTEVTNRQYRACIDARACEEPHDYSSEGRGYTTDHYPVTQISWEDANAFCRWANMRLPTALEWRKAAHGIDGRKFPWGDDQATCNLTNLYECWGYQQQRVMRVGAKPADRSPYGVVDMAGNVREWAYSGEDRYSSFMGNSFMTSEAAFERGFLFSHRDGLAGSNGQDLGFRCAADAQLAN